MDRISLQLQAQETEGDRQTVHTNYRFALLQNVIQSTNKPGWVARGATGRPQTQTRMGPGLGWTGPMLRGKAVGSRVTVPWTCQEPQDISD